MKTTLRGWAAVRRTLPTVGLMPALASGASGVAAQGPASASELSYDPALVRLDAVSLGSALAGLNQTAGACVTVDASAIDNQLGQAHPELLNGGGKVDIHDVVLLGLHWTG